MLKKNSVFWVLVWILQLIIAYVLYNAAMMKFENNEHVIQMFSAIGMEPAGRIIIGVLELIVAVLLLLPQSHIYGAFIGLGIMTGAIIGHFTDLGIEGLPKASMVFIGCAIIIYLRRHESSIFKHMFD